MASSIGVLDLSFVAEGDLSGSQYCAVALGSTKGTCKICGVNDKPIGVLQNKPKAGEAATVRRLGTTVVKANGAFSLGDTLAVAAATGKVDTAVTDTNPWSIGTAVEAAGATNDEIEALIEISGLDTTDVGYVSPLRLTVDGDLTASVASKVIEVCQGAGTIIRAGIRLGNTGADGTDALSLQGDVKINGTSVFSTKPVIAKAAADAATSFGTATGVTPGQLDATKVTVAAGDVVTFEAALTRTTPEDEMADLLGIVDIQYNVTVPA